MVAAVNGKECGRYELLERVDAGGMGEIFAATDPRSGERVAIKRLRPETAADPRFVEMFLDEAHLAERLEHPNICRVIEVGIEGRSHFIAMEWIDGASLRRLMEAARTADRPLPAPVVAKIGIDIARALEYSHRLTDGQGNALGIVHRDVSPRNIMVTRDGHVKLLDFGLAKARTQLHKTQPGFVKGKFGYLAPEQLTGEVDARTDLFALAICLYEALSGRTMFDQADAAATVQAIQAYDGPPSLRSRHPGAPRGLEEVLSRALAREPTERFASAAAMRQALEGAVPDPAPSSALARAVAEAEDASSEAPGPDHGTREVGHGSAEVDRTLEAYRRRRRRGALAVTVTVVTVVAGGLVALAGLLLD
jgi:serine/threonine-protein kinase